MTVDDLPPASLEAKLTYRISRKLEVFYTGGAAKLTRDGRLLACACSDEVKVRKSRSRFQMIVRVMSR